MRALAPHERIYVIVNVVCITALIVQCYMQWKLTGSPW